MCGITGWLDWTHDFRKDPSLIEDMTASMACRGPDHQGIWTNEHIALGHRRLSVIDIEGGMQPMVVKVAGHDIVIVFSGEIYNFRALREILRDRGHYFTTTSDTEVLLHAYVEWGPECVNHLDGMFAYAIWDERTKKLTLTRDRFGIKPLYYALLSNGIVFGSEPKALLASGQIVPRVDAAGMREIFDMVKTPGAAIFTDMRELHPGHYLSIYRDHMINSCYWSLQAREHTDDLETTVKRVLDLLAQVVRDQLVSDVPICTLLSGGLDSSAITALAAAEIKPGILRSFSVDYLASDDGFIRDAVREAPDSPYARALSQFVGTDHHEILLNGKELLSLDVREAVLSATDLPPCYWGDMWPSLYLLCREVKKYSTVALSGEGADELFGGYQWFFNPNAIKCETFPWLTSGSSRYFGGLKLFDRSFLADLKLDEARKQNFSDAIAKIPQLDGELEVDGRMRAVSYLNLTRFMQTLLDRKDRMSMAVGLEVRVPFCDHHLVEYVFNVPWRMKSFDGREKSLLRAAVKDMLPASIFSRNKNPYPAIQESRYESGLRHMLQQTLEDRNAPIWPLLDRNKVKTELQRNSTGVSLSYSRGGLEMCLWLNAWLNKYKVELML